jgi:hypothetical protein
VTWLDRRTSCGQPQATAIFPAHIRDGEAPEVLLRLGERAVGEQWRAARRINAEHRGGTVQAAGESR